MNVRVRDVEVGTEETAHDADHFGFRRGFMRQLWEYSPVESEGG